MAGWFKKKRQPFSKGVISHWLSVFKPAIQDYLESFFFFHCPTPRQLEHAVPVNERRKKLGTPIGRISVEIFSKRVRKGSNG